LSLLQPSPFAEYDCSFVQQNFPQPNPPPLAYTTLDFAELIVDLLTSLIGTFKISTAKLVRLGWTTMKDSWITIHAPNPCTQSSNVHFSDFRSNWSQKMRQKNLGDRKTGKSDKEIIHRWDGLDGLVVYLLRHLYLWCIHTWC
jgi:hypothetical protein